MATTEEIVSLSREVILDILDRRAAEDPGFPDRRRGAERRRHQRWPFPGTVELRPDDEDGHEHWFGTCRDLNETGLGMCCDRYFEPGTRLEISLHLPEASVYGFARVRYCMETPRGFMTGIEFNFPD